MTFPQSFFKYQSASTALSILENRALRWAHPSTFNDPFEIPSEITLPDKDEFISQLAGKKLIDIFRQSNPPSLAGTRLNMMIDILNHLKTEERAGLLDSLEKELQAGEIKFPEIQPHIQSFWTALHSRIRVLCLTTSNTNELMWAHYGDSHKGVVIELDCEPDNDSPWLTALRVEYSDAPPTAATAKDFVALITGNPHSLSFDKLFQPFIHTKGTKWTYEEEWRAFTYANDNSVFNDWKIIPPEVKAVYLGARIEVSQRERILEILHDQFPSTTVFKTSLSIPDREIHFQPA